MPSGSCSAPARIAPIPKGLVAYARGQEITVRTATPEPVQLDGEPDGDTPFTATVVPGAIRVMVPPDAGARCSRF